MSTYVTKESRGSYLHLQSNTKIHLLSRNSRIYCKFKYASIVQCYNPTPLVLLVNSYPCIVPGHTPNVHLIPSGNSNDQTKSILDFSFFTTQSLEQSSQPLLCSHLPSKFWWHPHLGNFIPWKGFLASEDTKNKAYPYLNDGTSNNMLMAINEHYLVPVSHNGPAPKMLYMHTTTCSNLFRCHC